MRKGQQFSEVLCKAFCLLQETEIEDEEFLKAVQALDHYNERMEEIDMAKPTAEEQKKMVEKLTGDRDLYIMAMKTLYEIQAELPPLMPRLRGVMTTLNLHLFKLDETANTDSPLFEQFLGNMLTMTKEATGRLRAGGDWFNYQLVPVICVHLLQNVRKGSLESAVETMFNTTCGYMGANDLSKTTENMKKYFKRLLLA